MRPVCKCGCCGGSDPAARVARQRPEVHMVGQKVGECFGRTARAGAGVLAPCMSGSTLKRVERNTEGRRKSR